MDRVRVYTELSCSSLLRVLHFPTKPTKLHLPQSIVCVMFLISASVYHIKTSSIRTPFQMLQTICKSFRQQLCNSDTIVRLNHPLRLSLRLCFCRLTQKTQKQVVMTRKRYIYKKLRCYISPISPEAPVELIFTKVDMETYLPDVIVYLKFHINQLRGFDSAGGRISPFPIGKPVCR